MKIHILGASGSGVTTLGKYLGSHLSVPYFDNDNFYWEKTDIPFTVKRNPEQRNQLLESTLGMHENWILGGSMLNWNNEDLISSFDLVVFLWIPAEIRLERLRKREFDRYGEQIFDNPEQIKKTQDFLDWASGYDINATNTTRTISNHTKWLAALKSPVLAIEGDFTVSQRIHIVQEKLIELGFLPKNNA